MRLSFVGRVCTHLCALLIAGLGISNATDPWSTGLSPDELGAVSDFAAISAIIKVQEQYFGDLERNDDGWMQFEDLVSRIDPALMRNLPVVDRWGSGILYRFLADDLVLLSRGPNGVIDDVEKLEEIFLEKYVVLNRIRAVRGDDLVFCDSQLVKGPVSLQEHWKRNLSDMRTISTAAGAYGVDNGAYPQTAQYFTALAVLQKLLSPVYVRRLPEYDSWGNEFKIIATGQHFVLVSYGSDGLPDIDYADVDLHNPVWGYPEFSAGESDIVHYDGRFLSYPRGFLRY